METVQTLITSMKGFWNSCSKYNKILIFSGFSISTLLSVRILLIKMYRKKNKRPPGHIGIFPFLNAIPTIISNGIFPFMINIMPKYGEICSYNIGLSTIYLLNNGPISKETFKYLKVKQWSDGDFIPQNKGRDIFGNTFKTIKTFKSIMSQESLNNTSIENGIKNALNKFIYPAIQQEKGKQMKVDKLFRPLIFDLIFYSVTGFHLQALDDPFYIEFDKLSDGSAVKILKFISNALLLGKTKFTSKNEMDHPYSPLIPIKECVSKYLDKNKKEIVTKNKNCFYTKLYQKGDYKNDEDGLIFDVAMIMNGGFETLSISLEFVLLCLAKHSNIQQLIYDELSSIFGKNGEIENIALQIKEKKLNNLQAFIHETLRMYPPAIGSNSRKVMMNEMNIGGYNVPKDGTVMMNIYAINRDEKYWKSPTDEFNINNFKNDAGKYKAQNVSFGSFGFGARSCPGIYLGKRILYNVIASLILKYKISLSKQYVDTPIGLNLKMFVHPNPTFPLQFESRQ